MSIIKSRYFSLVILSLVLIFAVWVRFYNLATNPPSLSWDEAAVSYNAWSVANYGVDEWGEKYPVYFKSFLDDKHPVHIYITAIFVKLFGLSEFSVRFAPALFGVFNIVLIFLIVQKLFKNNYLSLLSSFMMAISPYAIQFSRFNHELNFVLFFFLLGLLSFYKGLEKKGFYLYLAFFCFGLDLLVYHSAKVFIPPFLVVLLLTYRKELKKRLTEVLVGFFIFAIFIVFLILNPALLGAARIQQTAFSQDDLAKTYLFEKTSSGVLARVEIYGLQYLNHFSPRYLFISGDENRRHSTGVVGEMYMIDSLFLIAGLIYLLRQKSKLSVILLSWLLIAPIAASVAKDAPHTSRAMFMLPVLIIISALGFISIIELVKVKYLKLVLGVTLFLILVFSAVGYLKYYFDEYPVKQAIDWQYGMKQVVGFIKEHDEYDRVFVTDDRGQPYIFFLNYLETEPETLHNTIFYNESKSKSYSLVEHFDKYTFGNWDPIESAPIGGTLYVLTPSQYGGLKYRKDFDVKEIILYPNGTDAYFLVSTP